MRMQQMLRDLFVDFIAYESRTFSLNDHLALGSRRALRVVAPSCMLRLNHGAHFLTPGMTCACM